MVKRRAERLLLNRYVLGDVIGSGGMGSVHRALDRVLERPVAIKFLREEYGDDPQTVERFRREAQIAAGLMHPGIAQVFDFQQSDGRYFIVMELLEGEDLHTRIRTIGPMDPDVAARTIAAAADALSYAHFKGAVHRDIKPGNIFLTHDQKVKVTDFGIAIGPSAHPMTVTGKILGTALYLAPEQIEGQRATASSDIYSLGCTLYETLTGDPPFHAENQMAIAQAHLHRAPPSAAEQNPLVPKEVDAVIDKAMAKDPARRFDNAFEMATELRRAVGDTEEQTSPMDAPPTTLLTARSPATEELQDTAKRPPIARTGRRVRVIRAAVAAAVALILLSVLMLRWGESPPQANQLPDFRGRSYESVTAAAASLGIDQSKIDRVSGGFTDQPAGIVIRHEPDPGADITESTRLTLYVSEGIGVRVPNVKGEDLDDAMKTLKAAGFEPKVGSTVSGEENDIVADQDPPPATMAAPGAVVTLTITEEERKPPGKGKDRGNGD